MSPGSGNGKYLTCDEFRHWKNRRAVPAFVILTVVATLSGFLGYNASRESDSNLRHAGADAVLRSCLSRADIRITTASAIDDLRTAALQPPANHKQRVEQAMFLARTQKPINDLLTIVVGHNPRTVGFLKADYLDGLRVLSAQRCKRTTESQFGVDLGPVDIGH